MKRLFVIFLVLSFVNVYADKCTYEQKYELAKLANEIKIDYDEKSKEVHIVHDDYDYTSTEDWLELSIYNISKNFILEITNDYNDEVINVFSSNINDGKYSYDDYDYYEIINYTIKVINVTDCDRYTVRTINYKKPMFNPNYTFDICKENESIPFCNKLITSDKKIYDMGIGLEEAVDSFKQSNKENPSTSNDKSWIEKNYLYLIAAVLGMGILTVIVILINKKRSEI